MDPRTGDLLAAVAIRGPRRCRRHSARTMASTNCSIARATGCIRPGSTFKVVTAMAALRRIRCHPRRSTNAAAARRPRRQLHQGLRTARSATMSPDTVAARHGGHAARGSSCRATPISRSSERTRSAPRRCSRRPISRHRRRDPNTAEQLKESLPQSAYGQGQVVAVPFQMARVAATVANGGTMP